MLADMTESRELDGVGSHLACFHGGNLIMGGRLLDNDTITQAGIELSEACFNTYTSTAFVSLFSLSLAGSSLN